jgi:hypothetical protein
LDGEARTAQSTGQAVHHSILYARDNKDQRTSTVQRAIEVVDWVAKFSDWLEHERYNGEIS